MESKIQFSKTKLKSIRGIVSPAISCYQPTGENQEFNVIRHLSKPRSLKSTQEDFSVAFREIRNQLLHRLFRFQYRHINNGTKSNTFVFLVLSKMHSRKLNIPSCLPIAAVSSKGNMLFAPRAIAPSRFYSGIVIAATFAPMAFASIILMCPSGLK